MKQMKECLQRLQADGCDIQGALERVLDDEDLLIDCIKQVLVDDNFIKLQVAIKEYNIEDAFDASHSLKGIIGNTGLTTMYFIIEKIVEILRTNQINGIEELYKELINKQKYIINIMKM